MYPDDGEYGDPDDGVSTEQYFGEGKNGKCKIWVGVRVRGIVRVRVRG